MLGNLKRPLGEEMRGAEGSETEPRQIRLILSLIPARSLASDPTRPAPTEVKTNKDF